MCMVPDLSTPPDLSAGPAHHCSENRSSGSTANLCLLSTDFQPQVTKKCSCIRRGYSSISKRLHFSPPIWSHRVRSSPNPSFLLTSSTVVLRETLTSLLGASTAKGSRPSKTRIQPYSLGGHGLNPRVDASRRRDLRRTWGDELFSPSSQTIVRDVLSAPVELLNLGHPTELSLCLNGNHCISWWLTA